MNERVSDYIAVIEKAQRERDAALERLERATKLIEEGNLTLAILIDHETALRRIKSLDEKNVPKYAKQIAGESLARHPPARQITIDTRGIRAREFASQVMVIIGDVVSDKIEAMSRLVNAAYQTNAGIVTYETPPEDCFHDWKGPIVTRGNGASATCYKCGRVAHDHFASRETS